VVVQELSPHAQWFLRIPTPLNSIVDGRSGIDNRGCFLEYYLSCELFEKSITSTADGVREKVESVFVRLSVE
jgi:hypothetical protein